MQDAIAAEQAPRFPFPHNSEFLESNRDRGLQLLENMVAIDISTVNLCTREIAPLLELYECMTNIMHCGTNIAWELSCCIPHLGDCATEANLVSGWTGSFNHTVGSIHGCLSALIDEFNEQQTQYAKHRVEMIRKDRIELALYVAQMSPTLMEVRRKCSLLLRNDLDYILKKASCILDRSNDQIVSRLDKQGYEIMN
jgi:hypothetical protein